MAKNYTVSTKDPDGKGKKVAGYTGTFGKKITSKKTGKTYKGKNATKAAAKRRSAFSHMNK